MKGRTFKVIEETKSSNPTDAKARQNLLTAVKESGLTALDEDGRTIFIAAAEAKNLAAMKLFVELQTSRTERALQGIWHPGNIDHVCSIGMTALMHAVSFKDEECLDMKLQDAKENKAKREMVKLLMDAKANPCAGKQPKNAVVQAALRHNLHFVEQFLKDCKENSNIILKNNLFIIAMWRKDIALLTLLDRYTNLKVLAYSKFPSESQIAPMTIQKYNCPFDGFVDSMDMKNSDDVALFCFIFENRLTHHWENFETLEKIIKDYLEKIISKDDAMKLLKTVTKTISITGEEVDAVLDTASDDQERLKWITCLVPQKATTEKRSDHSVGRWRSKEINSLEFDGGILLKFVMHGETEIIRYLLTCKNILDTLNNCPDTYHELPLDIQRINFLRRRPTRPSPETYYCPALFAAMQTKQQGMVDILKAAGAKEGKRWVESPWWEYGDYREKFNEKMTTSVVTVMSLFSVAAPVARVVSGYLHLPKIDWKKRPAA
jgi:hypothetical protein